jgi:hypothetical protein
MKGDEILLYKDDSIYCPNIGGFNTIMHKGEKSLMGRLAEIVTKNGGDILEIGFGIHLSADAIQSNPNVKSHTIIEIHPEQYKRALEWSKSQKIKTTIILGDWIDILPISNMKFDGILHDTHMDFNIPNFLKYVEKNCKKGTIVGFFEFRVFDMRFNAVRHSLSIEEHQNLPYKNNVHYKNNQYELKYTTFDGNNFYKEIEHKTII